MASVETEIAVLSWVCGFLCGMLVLVVGILTDQVVIEKTDDSQHHHTVVDCPPHNKETEL